MHSREVGYEREKCLKDAELNVDALVDAVAHRRDDERHGGLGHGLERDEALERAERDRDDLRVLGRAPHEDGPQEVVGLRAIYMPGQRPVVVPARDVSLRARGAERTDGGAYPKQDSQLPARGMTVG